MSDRPPSPERFRKSAGGKTDREPRNSPWLVLLAGFLSAVLLLACCACGIGMWWFRPQIDADPQLASVRTTEMADIAIPPMFQPRGVIDWNLAFFVRLSGVYYERLPGDGVLSLVEVHSRLAHDADVRRHIRNTLLQEGAGGMPLVVDEKETTRRTYEIQGELVTFSFEIARDPATQRTFHVVEGVFPGHRGEVLLALRIDQDRWRKQGNSPGDEAAVLTMLEALASPPPSQDENPN